jgi:hypothetical protein
MEQIGYSKVFLGQTSNLAFLLIILRFGESFFQKRRPMCPYDRASLGHLIGASKALGLWKEGSIYDHILSAFLKVRPSQKHETGELPSSEATALTTIDLVEGFVRQWYL